MSWSGATASAASTAASRTTARSSSDTPRRSTPIAALALGIGASALTAAGIYYLVRAWKARRVASAAAPSASASPCSVASSTVIITSSSQIPELPMDEHSIPLPASYDPQMDYSQYDIFVLFPSTVEAEREKHYAVMKEQSLPGAENLLLEAQDAQKKACTYGLDDSEMELIPNLRLLRPKSLQFVHVSLENYPSLFVNLTPEQIQRVLVLNLCDGTEKDGIPGISVLRHLQSVGVAYTGADENFFRVSTYKIQMKQLFQKRRVATAVWRQIQREEIREWKQWREKEQTISTEAPATKVSTSVAASSSDDRPSHASSSQPSPFEAQFSQKLKLALKELRQLPYPMLVKPDDSYCSCGITTKSVCWTSESVLDYAMGIEDQFTAIFLEEFIRGREFTVFVAGDAKSSQLPDDLSTISQQQLLVTTAASPSSSSSSATDASTPAVKDGEYNIPATGLRVYAPIERVFDQSLPYYEQFISYELFWEIARATPGKDEFLFAPIAHKENIAIVDEKSKQQQVNTIRLLEQEALRAYASVGGCGYARVDMRYDTEKHKLAVLEVNANCGITQYKQTAMGEILRESKRGFHQVLDGFFFDSVATRNGRSQAKQE